MRVYGSQRDFQSSSHNRAIWYNSATPKRNLSHSDHFRSSFSFPSHNGQVRRQHFLQHRSAIRSGTVANCSEGARSRPHPHHGIRCQYCCPLRSLLGKIVGSGSSTSTIFCLFRLGQHLGGSSSVDIGSFGNRWWYFGSVLARNFGSRVATNIARWRKLWYRTENMGLPLYQKVSCCDREKRRF